jgi:hypothetical protein
MCIKNMKICLKNLYMIYIKCINVQYIMNKCDADLDATKSFFPWLLLGILQSCVFLEHNLWSSLKKIERYRYLSSAS